MITEEQAQEILRALNALPAEKLAEAQDFIRFLHSRYGHGQAIDESSEWSDEDLCDFAAASLNHAAGSTARVEAD